MTIAAGAKNQGSVQPNLASSKFTTASFNLRFIEDATVPAIIGGSLSVDPARLFDGNLLAVFNHGVVPATLTASTVVLSELGKPALAAETVTQLPGSGRVASIQVPASSETIKFNQPYQIHFDKTIADAVATGHTLKIFPCDATKQQDCSNNQFFTTLTYSPVIGPTMDANGNFSGFQVQFPYPFTASSVDLVNSFYIFPENGDGSVNVAAKIAPTCTSDGQTISCTLPAGANLNGNTTYQYGATFGGQVPGPASSHVVVPAAQAATPVTITPASGPAFTVPVTHDVTNSDEYTGSVTGTFQTACP